MTLLSERAEEVKRNNELRFWHHASVPGPVYWRKTRSMASTECVHEFLCKLGGLPTRAPSRLTAADELLRAIPPRVSLLHSPLTVKPSVSGHSLVFSKSGSPSLL